MITGAISSRRRGWRETRRGYRLDILAVATVGAALVTAGSWLGGQYWLLELLTHFRVQYLVGATGLAVAAVALRRPATALLTVGIAAANLVAAWPYLVTGTIDIGADAHASQHSMRVMSVNVSLRNRDYDRTLALVTSENPDVVGFLEADEAWTERLAALHEAYPYSVLRPEAGAYGIALLSRYPVRETSASPYIENDVQTAIMVEVAAPDATVSLILTHLMAPMSPGRARLRNRQLETLATMIRMADNPAQILIGDLNLTPWSPHFAALEQEAGLTNAAHSRGYAPTWPTGFSVVKIPIDHCLVSRTIDVRQFRTGPDIGSDHLPIIVDLTIIGREIAGTDPRQS